MNPEHHNINTGGGQPPGNSEVRRIFFCFFLWYSWLIGIIKCCAWWLQSQNQRVQSGQQQQTNLTPTTSATDLRVNTAAVNVALSSVAKYWVFTNLFPGPIPQVSVYGLPTGARIENGKPVQVLYYWFYYLYEHTLLSFK